MATNISTNPEVKKAATRGVLGAIGSALGGVLTGGILGRPSSSGGSQAGKGARSSTSTPSSGNYYVSDFDKNLSKGNSTFAEALPKYKDAYYKAYAAGDKDGMNLANKSLENLRLIYGGYLGGVSGSDYDVRNPHTNVNSYAATMQKGNDDLARQLYANMVKQGTQRIEAQRVGINRGYDDAARQAYVLSEQQKAALPQQMHALGMTGGASETTALRQGAQYQNNANRIATERQTAMTGLDSAIRDLQSSGDVQTAQYLLGSAEQLANNYLSAANADIGRHDNLNQQNIANAYQMAGLTGMLNGAPTLQKQQIDYNRTQDQLAWGVPFTQLAEQLGISPEQAAYLQMLQEQQAMGKAVGGRSGGRSGGGRSGGYSSYSSGYVEPDVGEQVSGSPTLASDYDTNSVIALGMGPMSMKHLEDLIDAGQVDYENVGGKLRVYRKQKPANKYSTFL